MKLKITIDSKVYEVEVEATEPEPEPLPLSGYIMQPGVARVYSHIFFSHINYFLGVPGDCR